MILSTENFAGYKTEVKEKIRMRETASAKKQGEREEILDLKRLTGG